jgi:hypothetical protein
MEEQLITFETAKLAKEKGFDIKVETFYMGDSEENFLHNAGKKDNWNNHKCLLNESELSNDYSAPTQSLLQKWFREEHGIDVYCMPVGDDSYKWYNNIASHNPVLTGTYEEALEVGLQEALKLINGY